MSKPLLKNIIFQNLALFLLPAIVIVGMALYLYESEKKTALLTISGHEKTLIKAGKIGIDDSLFLVKSDVEVLSRSYNFQLFLENHRDVDKVHFSEDYIRLMHYRKMYDQIRWIDETGMERIRIEYRNGSPKLVGNSELQNKRDRYYFAQSVNLSKGIIYVSPFDLNIDNNKIDIPYKPMIRFATVLMDTHGHRRGIFIINYLGSDLISRFERNTAASHGDTMILNDEGYWLKGTSHEDEWGFMRNRKDLTLAHRNVDAWKRIANENNGQFRDGNGLWTFQTVHPLEQSPSALRKTHKNGRGWKVVSFVPTDTLYSSVNAKFKTILLVSILALIAIAVVSFGLVYLYRKKEEAMNKFRELQQKTEGILLSVPDIIMQVDIQKHYVWGNTQGLEFFGAEAIGKEASDYFEGDQDTYENIHPMLSGEVDSVYVENWQRRKDGEKRLLAWWCQNLKNEEGTVTGALSTARDITEYKNAQKEIEKLSKALEQIDDIVYITDKFGNISYVNVAYCRYTGYIQKEVIGQNSRISKSGMHDSAFYKELWRTILSGEVYRNTLINRKKNGDLYYEKKTVTPLKDDNGSIIGFVSTGKDVTDETILHQKVERIAMFDQLTGIYNRHKFEELFVLESERSRRFSQPLSLILIDIDYFKAVNDTYGHDVGDKVLVQLAAIVQENIRKIDIFARWGGEEFLILCPGTDGINVRELAEKLRIAVAHSVFPVVGKITISLGLSSLNPEDSFSELFKRADQGLYYAKEHGRNQVAVSNIK